VHQGEDYERRASRSRDKGKSEEAVEILEEDEDVGGVQGRKKSVSLHKDVTGWISIDL
jgi:hypothetical protein